ncbi:MAG: hypothetical protein QM744_06240 [Mesorhizobium sp.]
MEDADDLDARLFDGGEQDDMTTAPATPRHVQGAQVPAEFGAVSRPIVSGPPPRSRRAAKIVAL